MNLIVSSEMPQSAKKECQAEIIKWEAVQLTNYALPLRVALLQSELQSAKTSIKCSK